MILKIQRLPPTLAESKIGELGKLIATGQAGTFLAILIDYVFVIRLPYHLCPNRLLKFAAIPSVSTPFFEAPGGLLA
ncbi:hypothetical protein, partial [Methylomonas sp. MgM2]